MTDWPPDVPCRGHDMFLPPASGDPDIEAETNELRRLCDGCPVRDECLQESLRVWPTDGIWGGLTRYERARIRSGSSTVEAERRRWRKLSLSSPRRHETRDQTAEARSIMADVADDHGVAVDDILSRDRTRDVTDARRVAIRTVWQNTTLPSTAIGRLFDRDHSTVLHHVRSDILSNKDNE